MEYAMRNAALKALEIKIIAGGLGRDMTKVAWQ